MQATATIDALPMAALLPFDPQHTQPRAVPFAFVDYLAQFGQAVGIAKHLKAHSASHRLRHLHGMREARQLFGVG